VSSLSTLRRRSRTSSALTILGLLAVAVAAGVLGPASPARAVPVDRYVATTGSDAGPNDCTNVASPCLTIQHAISQAVDGDTIIVAAGTYVQSSDIIIDKSLTLQGANVGIPGTGSRGPETIIDFNGDDHLLQVEHSNVTIDGFKFTNGDSQAILIFDAGSLSNLIVRNNVFEDLGSDAISNTGLAMMVAVYITDNKIVNVGIDDYCAIDIYNVFIAQISRNSIDTVNGCGIELTYGVSVSIEENVISDVSEAGIAIYYSGNVLIARNTIADGIGGPAVLLESAGDGIEVRNNFLAAGSGWADVLVEGNSSEVTIVITENAFGTSGTGLSLAAGTEFDAFDATCNWWRSAAGPTGAGAQAVDDPDGLVDYTPWLTSGTDTAPGTPGFQPGPCGSVPNPPVIQFYPEKLMPNGQWLPYGGEWHSGIVRVRVVCTAGDYPIKSDSTPARFWFEQDGTWTVAAGAVPGWRCRDTAGNIAADGPPAPIVARVDRRAPNCTVTPSPTSFNRNLAWQTVNVTLNPGAAPSGVDAIWLHSISGNASDRSGWAIGTEDYSGQLRGGGMRQNYTLTYAVRDNAGNVGYCSAIVKAN
jgi:parallel beta-helix repeat protein